MLFCSLPYYNALFIKLLQKCAKLLIFHYAEEQIVLNRGVENVFYYKKMLKLL